VQLFSDHFPCNRGYAFVPLYLCLPLPCVKGKVLPYLFPNIWPGADLGVQAVSPQMALSRPLSGRLTLLISRPTVILAAKEHHRPSAGTKLYCLIKQFSLSVYLYHLFYMLDDYRSGFPLTWKTPGILC